MSPASLTRRLRAPFTRTVTTAVDIDRPATGVWAVLTDFAGYPQWNPQIRRAEGELVAGRRVKLRMHPPTGRPVTIRPRVILVTPRRELRLRGSLPGIFSGEHWFTLEPTAAGRGTHVTQGEIYRGLIVPFIGRTVAAAVAGFQAHNAALKQRAETTLQQHHPLGDYSGPMLDR
jgi:hypothetical protein